MNVFNLLIQWHVSPLFVKSRLELLMRIGKNLCTELWELIFFLLVVKVDQQTTLLKADFLGSLTSAQQHFEPRALMHEP